MNSLSTSCSDLPFFICPPRVPSWEDDKKEENGICLAEEGTTSHDQDKGSQSPGECAGLLSLTPPSGSQTQGQKPLKNSGPLAALLCNLVPIPFPR